MKKAASALLITVILGLILSYPANSRAQKVDAMALLYGLKEASVLVTRAVEECKKELKTDDMEQLKPCAQKKVPGPYWMLMGVGRWNNEIKNKGLDGLKDTSKK